MSQSDADLREPGSSRARIYPPLLIEKSAQPSCPLRNGPSHSAVACAPFLRVGVRVCPNVPMPPCPHAPVSHKPPCPTAEQTAAISCGGPPARHSSVEESAHYPCPCTERTVACARGDPPSTALRRAGACPSRVSKCAASGERRAGARAASAPRCSVPHQWLTPCERKDQSVYCVSAECVEGNKTRLLE
jgi:hypothetical protein